jgi:hypothetical protein
MGKVKKLGWKPKLNSQQATKKPPDVITALQSI